MTVKNEKIIRTIRDAAFEHLCTILYYEDCTIDEFPDNLCKPDVKNARSVGHSYIEIYKMIHTEFPECRTTLADIRRYALLLRKGDFDYPQRLAQRRPRLGWGEGKNVCEIAKSRKRCQTGKVRPDSDPLHGDPTLS